MREAQKAKELEDQVSWRWIRWKVNIYSTLHINVSSCEKWRHSTWTQETKCIGFTTRCARSVCFAKFRVFVAIYYRLLRNFYNAVDTYEIKLLQNYLSLRRHPSEKNAWNYFKIISESYCSSWILPNMFNLSLKLFWNNFGRGCLWNKTLKLFFESISKLFQNHFISYVTTT